MKTLLRTVEILEEDKVNEAIRYNAAIDVALTMLLEMKKLNEENAKLIQEAAKYYGFSDTANKNLSV